MSSSKSVRTKELSVTSATSFELKNVWYKVSASVVKSLDGDYNDSEVLDIYNKSWDEVNNQIFNQVEDIYTTIKKSKTQATDKFESGL